MHELGGLNCKTGSLRNNRQIVQTLKKTCIGPNLRKPNSEEEKRGGALGSAHPWAWPGRRERQASWAGAVRRRWPGWAWRCGCGPGRQIEAEAGRSGTQQKRGQRSGLNRASAAALVSEEQKQQQGRPTMRAWGRVHSGEGLGAGRRSLTDPAAGHRFPATARQTGARGGIHGSRRTL